MPAYLSKEDKENIFKQFGGSEQNSGSVEGQIALFTHRIQGLSEHLKTNQKDHSCRRSLLRLVGKRRKLLKYLAHQDINKYRELLQTLGIRK